MIQLSPPTDDSPDRSGQAGKENMVQKNAWNKNHFQNYNTSIYI